MVLYVVGHVSNDGFIVVALILFLYSTRSRGCIRYRPLFHALVFFGNTSFLSPCCAEVTLRPLHTPLLHACTRAGHHEPWGLLPCGLIRSPVQSSSESVSTWRCSQLGRSYRSRKFLERSEQCRAEAVALQATPGLSSLHLHTCSCWFP